MSQKSERLLFIAPTGKSVGSVFSIGQNRRIYPSEHELKKPTDLPAGARTKKTDGFTRRKRKGGLEGI